MPRSVLAAGDHIDSVIHEDAEVGRVGVSRLVVERPLVLRSGGILGCGTWSAFRVCGRRIDGNSSNTSWARLCGSCTRYSRAVRR